MNSGLFHLTSKVPLNGTYDSWARRPRFAGKEHVVRARALMWAVFVFEKQRTVKAQFRGDTDKQKQTFPASVEIEDPCALGYKLITPRGPRVRATELYAPGSEAVFYHRLWEVLDPRSDLRACYEIHRYLVEATNEINRGGPLGLMRSPGAAPTLDAIAILCARLRLAKHYGEHVPALEIGCDIVRALCFLSLSKDFACSMGALTEIVVRSLLAGLSHDNVRLKSDPESYLAIFEVLSAMRVKVASATGRYPGSPAPQHTWDTYVGLFGWMVDLFCTPDKEGQGIICEVVQETLWRPGSPSLSHKLSPFASV